MSSIVGDILYRYMIIWSEYLERDHRFLSSDPRLKYLQKYLVLLFYDKSFSCHWSSGKNVKYNRSILIVPDTSLVWFLTYFQHVCWFVHNFCKLFSSFVWFWNEEGRRTMIVKFTVKISMMTETWNSNAHFCWVKMHDGLFIVAFYYIDSLYISSYLCIDM